MEHINPLNLVTDFQSEHNVRYIPKHLIHEYFESENPREFGDYGIVTSINEKFVFVRYFRDGILQHTAQSTDPRDLINDSKPIFSRWPDPSSQTK